MSYNQCKPKPMANRAIDKFTINELSRIKESHRTLSNAQAAKAHSITPYLLNQLVMEYGWKKATIKDMNPRKVAKMLKDFPNMTNKELSNKYGFSVPMIQVYARKEGVYKTKEHISKARNTSRSNPNKSTVVKSKTEKKKARKRYEKRDSWPSGWSPIF